MTTRLRLRRCGWCATEEAASVVAMDFRDRRRKFGTAGSGEKFILLDRTTARPFLARVELVSA